MIIDLAYVYVPSAEVPGSFVNLGKRQRLECTIKAVALEVGEEALAAISRARPRGGLVDRLTGR